MIFDDPGKDGSGWAGNHLSISGWAMMPMKASDCSNPVAQDFQMRLPVPETEQARHSESEKQTASLIGKEVKEIDSSNFLFHK